MTLQWRIVVWLAASTQSVLCLSTKHSTETTSNPLMDQWQPIIALLFAEDHTGTDTTEGVAAYFESFAACGWSK